MRLYYNLRLLFLLIFILLSFGKNHYLELKFKINYHGKQ